jgi:DNA polymerase-3 subunit delta
MDSLRTVPLFSGKRVVIIKDLETISDKSLETIMAYLGSSLPTSVFVMISAESFKKNKNYQSISRLAKVIAADKPSADTVKKWVVSFFSKKGIAISPGAVNLILELKGDDTSGIKMELEKLAAFSGGKNIDDVHVEQVVGRSVRDTVFNLVDALNKKDAKWLFRVMDDLFDQKKQPHEIIGYIGWYMRLMQKIVGMKMSGEADDEIIRKAGVKPYHAKKLISEARKYPARRIEEWNSALMKADIDIKTGKKPPKLALEMMLTGMLSGGPSAPAGK